MESGEVSFGNGDKKVLIQNSGLAFFTWAMLFVLFWDFGEIDLYDAIVANLTHEVAQ